MQLGQHLNIWLIIQCVSLFVCNIVNRFYFYSYSSFIIAFSPMLAANKNPSLPKDTPPSRFIYLFMKFSYILILLFCSYC